MGGVGGAVAAVGGAVGGAVGDVVGGGAMSHRSVSERGSDCDV